MAGRERGLNSLVAVRAEVSAVSVCCRTAAKVPTGTASLADLTRAWQLRQFADQRIREGAAEAAAENVGEPSTSQVQSNAALDRLLTLAGSLTDRRGRNSADVLFISGLSALEQWKKTQAEAKAAAVQNGESR